ncbi:MAG: FAD/NAD(P)-binding oxidoreductase [Solirubrobacteraceae bacterium]
MTHRVLIVGGGAAGLTVAARLRRAAPRLEVTVLEPSGTHDYQPLWTLVGAGVVPKERSRRAQADVIPAGVRWLRDEATELRPDERAVVTAGGTRVEYDALVVACGLRLDWDAIPGLRDALAGGAACSIYGYERAQDTWAALQRFDGGTALFTMPGPPIKCPGAPQKIAYLADDALRRRGVRERSRIIYASAMPGIFSVPHFAPSLDRVIERRKIEARYRHELVAVRPEAREALFRDGEEREVVIPYDLLHAVPPQAPPAVVASSTLSDAAGWLEVDRHTLRHPRHPEVFALGDASNLPTSKTAAAIRAQAPVLVRNLLRELGEETAPPATYDGYAACPLVTGYGRVVLAEFDYEKRPQPTFPFDQRRERRSMYELKRRGLPALYWRGMLRGRA